MKRNSIILKKESTALLIIDLQERILPVIRNYETVLENTVKLIKGFKAMQLLKKFSMNLRDILRIKK